MNLDGAGADPEVAANFLVGSPQRHASNNVAFPLRQPLDPSSGIKCALMSLAKVRCLTLDVFEDPHQLLLLQRQRQIVERAVLVRLDRLGDARIESLTVKHGLPFGMHVEAGV